MGRIDTYPQNAILQPNSPVTLGYAQVTSNQNGISTTRVDATGLSVTVAVSEGRRIRISGFAIFQKQTSGGFTRLFISEGATDLTESIFVMATGEYLTLTPSVVITPSAGVHTYKLTADSQNASTDLNAGAAFPAYILVEDITGMPIPVSPTSVPVGQLAYAQITSVFTIGNTGTATDVSGLSVNITVPAGRVLKLTTMTHLRSTVTTDTTYVGLNVDGSGVGFSYLNETAANPNTGELTHIFSPSAGSHVIKVIAQRQAGTGSLTVYADSLSPSWLLVEDITGTPAVTNGAPSSTLAYAEVTSDQGSITTETDLTGLAVTVTVPAGRRIRIIGHSLFSSTQADEATGFIKEGSTYLGRFAKLTMPVIGNLYLGEGSVTISPSAGSHTYKLTAARTGTGTMSANADAGGAGTRGAAYILVEDITASTFTYSQPGVLPVNSTSLPSNPSIGAMVYEVDTGATKIWNGTSWQIFGQGSSTTLGYAEVSSNQGSITTTAVDITGLSVTVVVPAGRRIKVSARNYWTSTTSDGDAFTGIFEGGTQLQEDRGFVGGTVQPFAAEPSVILSPSAGSHTYKVVGKRITGTGTLTNNAFAGGPCFILVEDVTGTIPPAPAITVPVGVLGFAENSADQSVTTTVDLTSLSVNVSVPTGRTVRVTGQISVQSSVSGDLIDFFVYDNGVDIKHREWRTTTANVAEAATIEVILSPSAGAHTYNLRAGRGFSATGTITIIGTSDRKGSIIVEDITPTPTLASVAPSSTLGYAEVTANQGTYTAVTDITGLTLTVVVAAGRRLRISSEAYVQSSVANDGIDWRIQEGATILQNGNLTVGAATTVENQSVSVIITPSAGSHTYKIASARSSGTGNITMVAAAQNPAFILIEDITPTSVQPSAIVPGAIVANSTARPSSPALGTEIFEPDTGLMKVWNGSSWITETNMRMFNVSSSLAGGSVPAIDTGSITFKMQCGTNVDTTSASGLMTLTFPTAFPNGLISCVVCQGGNTVQDAIFATTGGSSSTITIVAIHGNNTVVNGALVRYNWIAIGW